MAIVKSLAASSVRPWLRFSKNNQTVTGIEVCSRRAIPAFCATCRGTSVVPRVLVLTHRHLHKSPCDRRPFAEISGSISFSPLWFLSRKLCPIFVCQFKGSLQLSSDHWGYAVVRASSDCLGDPKSATLRLTAEQRI